MDSFYDGDDESDFEVFMQQTGERKTMESAPFLELLGLRSWGRGQDGRERGPLLMAKKVC